MLYHRIHMEAELSVADWTVVLKLLLLILFQYKRDVFSFTLHKNGETLSGEKNTPLFASVSTEHRLFLQAQFTISVLQTFQCSYFLRQETSFTLSCFLLFLLNVPQGLQLPCTSNSN